MNEEKLTIENGELIAGWNVKRLGDVCEIDKKQGMNQGLPYVGMEHIGSNNAEFLGSMEVLQVKSSTFIFNDEHVLYGRLRPYLNKVLMPNFVGHCSTEIFPIKPSKLLHRKFLLYWFLNDVTVEKINSTCTGARMPRANMKEVMNFNIFVPPLPEQKRIVAILDEAFTGISLAVANAEKNLVNARELFESYLNNIFTQKNNATLVKLSEITTNISDGDHSAPPKSPEGIPFITISNINKKNRLIDFTNTFKVPEEYFNNLKSNRKPRFGDVIYTVTGSYGIPVKVPPHVDFCFQRHIGLLRPQEGINSSWLYYALLSPLVFKQATNGATGTAQKTVSLKVLRSIRVPIMSMPEQKDAVEKLDKIWVETQQLEAIYQQKLTALNELKQSILQKAFSGQLTNTIDKDK